MTGRQRPPDHLVGRHPGDWQPVDLGRSAAAVWRVSGPRPVYVKLVPEDGTPTARVLAEELRAEALRAEWLRSNGFPAPRVLESDSQGGYELLITSVVPGLTLADPWPRALHPVLIDGLADLARGLHALPAEACPFRRDLAVLIPAAIVAVEQGTVDEADFDDERFGRAAGDVLGELLSAVPESEDAVVCHGDLCLPNVLADPETGRITGVVDLGRFGVADRHQDLALATRSLGTTNPQYGPAAARRFVDRYGLPVDPRLIEFYRLLDEFF